MPDRPRIAVLGAGAWGTALAVQAARAGHAVTLWGRDRARVAEMAKARENARYLPGVKLSPAITPTEDLGAVAGSVLILAVVPAQHLRAVLQRLPAGATAPIVVCSKGVEAGTLRLPLEVEDIFSEWLLANFPHRYRHLMSLVRGMRGGKAYDSTWGKRMTGDGPYAWMTGRRFELAATRLGFNQQRRKLRTDLFARPHRAGEQLTLF